MLPPSLQFELAPRRASTWLKVILAASCLAIVAGALAWLVPRQMELSSLQMAVREAATQQAGQPVQAAASAPVPWQTVAEQDGKLFALTLDARLLEVERCTDSTIRVRRLQLDEATGDAALEIEADGKTRLDELVECLTGQAHRRWRIASVEVASDAGAAAGAIRVLIRR